MGSGPEAPAPNVRDPEGCTTTPAIGLDEEGEDPVATTLEGDDPPNDEAEAMPLAPPPPPPPASDLSAPSSRSGDLIMAESFWGFFLDPPPPIPAP